MRGCRHFLIEHLNHHVDVGTPADPDTAALGVAFHSWFPGSLRGGLLRAWESEARRLAAREEGQGEGAGGWWAVARGNRMVRYMLQPTAFCLVLAYLTREPCAPPFSCVWPTYDSQSALRNTREGEPGPQLLKLRARLWRRGEEMLNWKAFDFFFAQSGVGIAIDKLFNYVEHYGLERRRQQPDSGSGSGSEGNEDPEAQLGYEAVKAHHSWDATFVASSFLFFQVQRHSEHHTRPKLPYQLLTVPPEAPRLPTGYPGAFVLVVSGLWTWVMEDRVRAARARGALAGGERPTTGRLVGAAVPQAGGADAPVREGIALTQPTR